MPAREDSDGARQAPPRRCRQRSLRPRRLRRRRRDDCEGSREEGGSGQEVACRRQEGRRPPRRPRRPKKAPAAKKPAPAKKAAPAKKVAAKTVAPPAKKAAPAKAAPPPKPVKKVRRSTRSSSKHRRRRCSTSGRPTSARPTGSRPKRLLCVEDLEPGDVQFDEESGEGDTINVERERDLRARRRPRCKRSRRSTPRSAQSKTGRTACLRCRASRSRRSASGRSRGRLSEWRRRWAGWAPPHGDVTGRRGRLVLALGIAAAVILVDQLTKWWAVVNLQDRIIHLFWTFQLNLTFNSGMAFGRGRGFGPLIAVVGIVLVTVLLLGTSRAPDEAGRGRRRPCSRRCDQQLARPDLPQRRRFSRRSRRRLHRSAVVPRVERRRCCGGDRWHPPRRDRCPKRADGGRQQAVVTTPS